MQRPSSEASADYLSGGSPLTLSRKQEDNENESTIMEIPFPRPTDRVFVAGLSSEVCPRASPQFVSGTFSTQAAAVNSGTTSGTATSDTQRLPATAPILLAEKPPETRLLVGHGSESSLSSLRDVDKVFSCKTSQGEQSFSAEEQRRRETEPIFEGRAKPQTGQGETSFSTEDPPADSGRVKPQGSDLLPLSPTGEEVSCSAPAVASLHRMSVFSQGSKSSSNDSTTGTNVAALDPQKASNMGNGRMGDNIVKAAKNKKKRSSHLLAEGQASGRWTTEEHQAFLRGLSTYGREWKKVAQDIPTRSSSQVRSHAQKYFAKLQREEDSWLSFQQQQPVASGDVSSSLDSSSRAEALIAAPSSSQAQREQYRQQIVQGASEELSASVRANVARILAQPESVQAEVEDTLRQLKERYQLLQQRLQQQQLGGATNTGAGAVVDDRGEATVSSSLSSLSPTGGAAAADLKSGRDGSGGDHAAAESPPDDHSSGTSISSLQNEELMALHGIALLQGALTYAADASLGSRSMSTEGETEGGNQQSRQDQDQDNDHVVPSRGTQNDSHFMESTGSMDESSTSSKRQRLNESRGNPSL